MREKQREKQRRKFQRESNKLRQTIALEAAKMMYDRTESEYFTAKRKAARKMGINFRYHPMDLPSNREIRDEILSIAHLYEGQGHAEKLKQMRLYALWLMRELQSFTPKLIGSTLTGHIRKGSDIDIHIFSASLTPVTQVLENMGLQYHVERKRIVKYNTERHFTHIHLHGLFEAELTLYSPEFIHYRFKSSITGKPIEFATVKQLESLIAREYPDCAIGEEIARYQSEADCYEMFKLLLLPLEGIKGGLHHPEGDMLYHSLQVFELARREGYAHDVEFLQAALLHDIGKAIDPRHHAEVAAETLSGFVSSRVIFLIAHHMHALYLKQGTLGHKKARKLRQSEYFDDLMALRDFDTRGRERGVLVDTLNEVLEFVTIKESYSS